jgi:glycine/D-amino acid oxidase-like deaminating enzyme
LRPFECAGTHDTFPILNTIASQLDHADTECGRDSITRSQDWIISPHDYCSNLFIATGGSFHAWKFLPVLGANIVDMMDGILSPEKAQRWAWTAKHNSEGGACSSYIPKRDMKDVMSKAKLKPRV